MFRCQGELRLYAIISSCALLAGVVAGCARMPNPMVSDAGSSIKFSGPAKFTYQRFGQSPIRCERTPDADLNTLSNEGEATCADGTKGYFRRLTGMYLHWIEVQFDSQTFVEPGRAVRSRPIDAAEPPPLSTTQLEQFRRLAN